MTWCKIGVDFVSLVYQYRWLTPLMLYYVMLNARLALKPKDEQSPRDFYFFIQINLSVLLQKCRKVPDFLWGVKFSGKMCFGSIETHIIPFAVAAGQRYLLQK